MQHLSDLARLLVEPATGYVQRASFGPRLKTLCGHGGRLDPQIDVKRRVARGISGTIASLNEAIMFPFESIQAEAR